MKFQFSPKYYLLFFLVINLLQSYFTPLANDEAYYWIYAQNLDFGYFDHPPGVAVLVAMGYALIKNELGVRLFIVLASSLSLWFIWKTVAPKNHHLFFLLFLGSLVPNVGFMAVPDIPLLLCASAFLYFLKSYLEKDSWIIASVLAVVVAGMGYSKYHGIILLVPALLANLSLLQRKSFWYLLVLATVLFFPHLYWQFANDYPTFRFHFFDRSAEPYTFLFILEYIGGQLLIYGPLLGIPLFWGAWKFSGQNNFDRTMKWVFYGTFVFFLFSSLKGRVEPNWTIAGIVPLLYLAYHFLEQSEKWTTWIYRMSITSIVLIGLARIFIALDVAPVKGIQLPREFYGWTEWADDLSELAQDLPVIFYNNYQRAAKYQFYAQKEAYSLNTSIYAGSQYDLLIDQQEALQGKKVMIVNGVPMDQEGIELGEIEKVKYQIVDNFRFYNRVRIKMLTPIEKLKPNEKGRVQISIFNPSDQVIEFIPNAGRSMQLQYVVYEMKRQLLKEKAIAEFPLERLAPGEEQLVEVSLQAPAEPGNYRYRFAIYNGLLEERNCNFQQLLVE